MTDDIQLGHEAFYLSFLFWVFIAVLLMPAPCTDLDETVCHFLTVSKYGVVVLGNRILILRGSDWFTLPLAAVFFFYIIIICERIDCLGRTWLRGSKFDPLLILLEEAHLYLKCSRFYNE